MRVAIDEALGRIVTRDMTELGCIAAEVLWTSPDGRYVVVEGPFPYGFQRTITCKTVDLASRRQVRGGFGIRSRAQTATRGQYAKVLASKVVATHNEHGEIAP